MRLFANICFLFSLLWTSFAFADAAPSFPMNKMPPPRVEIRYTEPDPEVGTELLVVVTVVPGWHVNANVVADEFLLPSRIEAGAKGIEFGEPVWPEAKKEYSEALLMDNLVFKDTFQVRLPIRKMASDADPSTTHVIFHYQACSNSICLAPDQVSVSLDNAPAISTDIPATETLKKKPTGLSDLLILLGLAFLGGLLLNLMPCVLPVLSLKVFSLVRQSHESRRRIFALGIATTLGILLSFWALAGVIVALKAAGGLVGWGFQFQHPVFLSAMAVLLVLFSTNLLGAFEIWLPGQAMTRMDHIAHKEGPWGAFFHGALLTLLSTPCSAPFLGTAMGFAFGASPFMLFLFFGTAALGLAMPYLLVSAFPRLVRWLPKPGAWMVRFKQFLAFPMLGTLIWLVWVLSQQAGATAAALLMALAGIAAMGAWFVGWLAPPGKPYYRVVLLWAITALTVLAFWRLWVGPAIDEGIADKREAKLERSLEGRWQPYSPESMAQYAKERRTVFLDFTADWCITCKANEKAVLDRDTVRAAFAELGVVAVKADWTTQDPRISKLLAAHGRSGVPFYLVYPAHDHSNPIALSELLTVQSVLEALEKAGPSQM